MIETAVENVAQIKKQFSVAVRAHGMPEHAALFYSGASFPRTTLFISPAAVEIAKTLLAAHDGRPCEKPERGVYLDGHFGSPALVKSPFED